MARNRPPLRSAGPYDSGSMMYCNRSIVIAGLLALVLVGVLLPRTVEACACDPNRRWTVASATLWADRVVVGRVVELERDMAWVRVEDDWKGEGDERISIDNRYLYGGCCATNVQRAPRPGAPELRFRVGDRVLLYLQWGDPLRPVMTESGVVGQGFYRVSGGRLLRAGCFAGWLSSHRRKAARALADQRFGRVRRELRPRFARSCRCSRRG